MAGKVSSMIINTESSISNMPLKENITKEG